MPSTGLFGPHELSSEEIDTNVKGIGTGAYALGHINDEGTFIVKYVGRSDDDLNGRLKWTGKKYTAFKFGFYQTVKAAFEKECQMFHDFGGTKLLDNIIHPDRPNGTSHACPQKDCTDLD